MCTSEQRTRFAEGRPEDWGKEQDWCGRRHKEKEEEAYHRRTIQKKAWSWRTTETRMTRLIYNYVTAN